jgi:hypothetical protein
MVTLGCRGPLERVLSGIRWSLPRQMHPSLLSGAPSLAQSPVEDALVRIEQLRQLPHGTGRLEVSRCAPLCQIVLSFHLYPAAATLWLRNALIVYQLLEKKRKPCTEQAEAFKLYKAEWKLMGERGRAEKITMAWLSCWLGCCWRGIP